jgi:Phospholipase A2-like domain
LRRGFYWTRLAGINVINVAYVSQNGVVKIVTLVTMSRDFTDGDFIETLNSCLPFEKHLPGMRYAGPGTRLSKRLYPDGTPRPGSEPVDRVDEAAMRHDIQYEMYQDRRHRLDADKVMINELINIEKPTCRERIERFFVLPIMFVKRCITACLLRIPIINR